MERLGWGNHLPPLDFFPGAYIAPVTPLRPQPRPLWPAPRQTPQGPEILVLENEVESRGDARAGSGPEH